MQYNGDSMSKVDILFNEIEYLSELSKRKFNSYSFGGSREIKVPIYDDEISVDYTFSPFTRLDLGYKRYVLKGFRTQVNVINGSIIKTIEEIIQLYDVYEDTVYKLDSMLSPGNDNIILYIQMYVAPDEFENHPNHKTLLDGLGEL